MQAWLRAELALLLALQPSDRPWQMPLAAGLASGLPLLAGAAFGRLEHGLVASLGGLAFLYLPRTPLAHRMVTLMACAFGMTACHALGLLSQFMPALGALSLGLIALLATMVCRAYALAPPGSFFFVMVAAIGAATPARWHDVPLYVGLFTLGGLLACLIAFGYSLHMLRRRAPLAAPTPTRPGFDFVVFDALLIGAFVALSVLAAQALRLERPYWVPISCMAVIQGATLRAVWTRQLHRVAGTAVGLLLAWGLLAPRPGPWLIGAMVLALTFVVEMIVIRHYGVAAMFITPLTLLLAEAAALGQQPINALLQARLADTVLGSALGVAGGACIHSTRLRAAVSPVLRRLLAPR